ncbi:MAG: DUF6597 domain-containing transcriptional factor [Lachnospiraceae bacterium]
MLTFNQIYHPVISRPFLADQSYMEYRPCLQLQPYVACFWTSDEHYGKHAGEKILVVPDTCMDIIVRINHTRQEINGFLSAMQDQPFMTAGHVSGDLVSGFSIRFHFWAAHLFMDLNYRELYNQSLPLEALRPEWVGLFGQFFDHTSLTERISMTETFLLNRLNQVKMNHNLFNSIQYMLAHPGRATVTDICAYSCVSQRQMERLYQQHIGLPLKRISSLVRYQNVWHDMVSSRNFDIQDAVQRYGYTDQAHLLKDFKRFHGVTPTKAWMIACSSR